MPNGIHDELIKDIDGLRVKKGSLAKTEKIIVTHNRGETMIPKGLMVAINSLFRQPANGSPEKTFVIAHIPIEDKHYDDEHEPIKINAEFLLKSNFHAQEHYLIKLELADFLKMIQKKEPSKKPPPPADHSTYEQKKSINNRQTMAMGISSTLKKKSKIKQEA